MDLRRIGQTDLQVTPVAMGCWPIAGITSINVTEEHSLRTLKAAFDAGVNFFDTAYAYGYNGESETMVGQALGQNRDQVVIASKCGIVWQNRVQVKQGHPGEIRRQCEESLRRLATDYIDLHYLHAPDPDCPIEDSAAALKELLDAGKIRAVGVSNFHDIELYERFQAVCPISADQPHYNMLQREIEHDRLPWCVDNNVSVIVYWPLMKGLLAGKLKRDHQFDPKDGRQKYPIFKGEQWTRNHDFLDELRPIADEAGVTLPQLVINWTIHRTGITAALCGAKRPEQITETAGGMGWQLSEDQLKAIDRAIENRGEVISRSAV